MELKCFCINLFNEDFKFNSAHFICETCEIREYLHGHNYSLSFKLKCTFYN